MVTMKNVESDLNFDGIIHPMNNDNVNKFEEQIPNVSIHVLEIDEVKEQIVKHRAVKNKDATCHIDSILSICVGLLTVRKSKFWCASFCVNIVNGYGTPELPKKHDDNGCMEVEGQKIEMPKPHQKMKFKHHFKKLRCPCVIYADFKCLTEEVDTPTDQNIETFEYQEHKPCGFMLQMVNSVDGSNF